jgi:DNA-binding NtrC family response regulator
MTAVAESCRSLVPAIPVSRILLIDDDPALLEGLAEMLRLRLQPIHVDTCHGAVLAVRLVQQGAYDIILCDVCMPDTNGLELLPRLRAVDAEASILMMSATLDRSARNRVLADGATGFISKPFDRDDLTRTLKEALKHHHLSESPAPLTAV